MVVYDCLNDLLFIFLVQIILQTTLNVLQHVNVILALSSNLQASH